MPNPEFSHWVCTCRGALLGAWVNLVNKPAFFSGPFKYFQEVADTGLVLHPASYLMWAVFKVFLFNQKKDLRANEICFFGTYFKCLIFPLPSFHVSSCTWKVVWASGLDWDGSSPGGLLWCFSTQQHLLESLSEHNCSALEEAEAPGHWCLGREG